MAMFYCLLRFFSAARTPVAVAQAGARKQKIQQHVFPAVRPALGSPLTRATSGKGFHAVQPTLPCALAVLQLPFLFFEVSPALLSNNEKEKEQRALLRDRV